MTATIAAQLAVCMKALEMIRTAAIASVRGNDPRIWLRGIYETATKALDDLAQPSTISTAKDKGRMRSKLEMEAAMALGIAQSMGASIAALEKHFPPGKCGSRVQHAIDEIKEKRAAIEACLCDCISSEAKG